MPNTKLSLLALAFAACTTSNGGPTSSNVSHQQASSVYAAASARMATAFKAIGSHASLTGTLSATSSCALGGDLALDGTYDSSAGFDATASFTACEEAQGTLDGDLHWLETINAAGITDSWAGTLTFVDANGNWSCVFDYRSVVTEGSVHLSGTICGYDVTTDLDL